MKKYVNCNSNSEKICLEYPDICPICGKAIMPRCDHSFKNNVINVYSVLFECTACGKGFLSHYESLGDKEVYDGSRYNILNRLGTYPQQPEKKNFDVKLEEMSPSFCKIYNEALFAEKYGLNEVSGIGYRKSLEFLIKDYSIYLHPESKEKIENEPLSQVITEFIDVEKIKKLAKASAWIGNDETHYVRKYEDKDIKNLKRFIDATVAYINYELISDEATELVESK